MKTIASEVLDYIKTKPFLMSALSQGIINLTSLAREIQPDIEKSLKKSAKSGAIVMALKRISDNQEFLSTHKIVRVLKNLGDITVRSSLADYCFKITDTLGVYLFFMKNYLQRGSITPREVISPTIKNVIINQRKLKFTKQFEKDILQDAIKSKTYEMY